MYGIDKLSHRPKWVFHNSFPNTPGESPELASQPIIDKGKLYFPMNSGLYVLDPSTGRQKWNIPNWTLRYKAFSPISNALYFDGAQSLMKLDLSSRKVGQLGVPDIDCSGIQTGNNVVYYMTTGGDSSPGIYAVKYAGKLLLHDAIGGFNGTSRIMVRGNYLYVPTDQSLYAIDARNGHVMWIKSGLNGNPLIYGNDLYVFSQGYNSDQTIGSLYLTDYKL